MAERTVKINLDVDAKTGQAAIQKTSTQIKDLGKTSTTSSTAISTGMKTANTQVQALGKNATVSSAAMKKSSTAMKTGMKAASAQTKSLGTDLQKTSKQIKTVGTDAIKSGASVSSGMKSATTDVKALGAASQKASKQVTSIGKESITSAKSIHKLSSNIKGLETGAAVSDNIAASFGGINISTAAAAGGMAAVGAAATNTSASMDVLAGKSYRVIKATARNSKEALKMAAIWVQVRREKLRNAKASGASADAIERYTKTVTEAEASLKKLQKEQIKTNAINKETKEALGSKRSGLIGALYSYKTAIIAIGAVGAVIAYNMTKASAAAEQQREAFSNLAASHGADSNKIIADLKKMSAYTVDTATIIQKAGTAMMMGIDPTKLSQLMEIARATSKMTGQSVVEAFDNISMAVGRQSKMILDNLGIIVSIDKANKNYAKQMGIVGRELTDVEKKQAFLNETLTKGKDLINRIGSDSLSNVEKFQQFETAVKDLKIAFGGLLLVLTPVLEVLTEIVNFMASFEQAAIDLEATGWMAKPSFMEKPKADSYVDITTPKGGAVAGEEETTIGPASAEGLKKAEEWFAEWQRMEKQNQINIIKIKHDGYQQSVSLLMLEKQAMIDKYGEQTAINEHYQLRLSLLNKAEQERIKAADEAAINLKAENTEKVLSYISTELENKKRAIQQEAEMLMGLTESWEEHYAIREEAQKRIDALGVEDNSEKIAAQESFYEQYNALGMSSFDLEREALLNQAEAWEELGISKIQIATLVEAKLGEIRKREFEQQLAGIQQTAGVMADGFKMISEMGGKHSKKAFAMYKAFKITETLISTYSGAMKAYESMASIPYVGTALGVAAAAAVVGFGMARVAQISAQQPPSYDQGGVSNAKGVYQTGNIAEAHIPIPSGGKIPVEVKDKEKEKELTPQEINIVNVINPAMFDEYLSSADGQDAILNVIGNRAQSVKRYLR